MDKNTVVKPEATQQPPQCPQTDEFDPFSKAKPCSPFYLYNHDSPRPSGDFRSKKSMNVSVTDLENQCSNITPSNLTPSTTREKMDNNINQEQRLWHGLIPLTSRCERSMTKPKEKGWLQRMPKKQRLIVKLIIALVVIGCMVGIAVGLAVGLRSTVNKGNNKQGNIG